MPRLRPVRAAPTMSTVAQTAVHIAKPCRAGKCTGPLIDSAAVHMVTAERLGFRDHFPILSPLNPRARDAHLAPELHGPRGRAGLYGEGARPCRSGKTAGHA